MSDEIIKVLDYLGKKFGLAIDWSSANIMPYLEELGGKIVNYEISISIIWIVFAAILIGIGVFTIVKNKDDCDEGGFILCSVSAVFVFIGIIMALVQSFDIATAVYLPEKTILEFMINAKSTIIANLK